MRTLSIAGTATTGAKSRPLAGIVLLLMAAAAIVLDGCASTDDDDMNASISAPAAPSGVAPSNSTPAADRTHFSELKDKSTRSFLSWCEGRGLRTKTGRSYSCAEFIEDQGIYVGNTGDGPGCDDVADLAYDAKLAEPVYRWLRANRRNSGTHALTDIEAAFAALYNCRSRS